MASARRVRKIDPGIAGALVTRTTVLLPVELHRNLAFYARKANLSQSEIVRKVVHDYLLESGAQLDSIVDSENLFDRREGTSSRVHSNIESVERVPAITVVNDITPELLRSLQEDPKNFMQLSPERFEHFAAERLERMGFKVTLAGATLKRDGGIDLIAAKRLSGIGDFLVAGQVKHHSVDARTGREAVDRMISLNGGLFSFGLLVTNTSFTRDARWAAELPKNRFFARLRDINDIKRWLEGNFRADVDFTRFPEQIEIAPGIWIQLPRRRCC